MFIFKNKLISFLKNKKNKAFSLLEVIIYLAIFGTLSIFIINSFIVSISSFNRTSINHSLAESGISSLDRISREIRNSSNIDIISSTDTILQMNGFDNMGSPSIVKISKDLSDLNIYRDGVLIGNLLDEDVSVSGLIFRRFSTSSGEAVKIEMSLSISLGRETKTENFYTTVILRGSY